MKFRVAKRTLVPLGHTKFHVNWCNADFWPVSKFNTGSLPLRGILPVTTLSKVNTNDVNTNTLNNLASI